MAGVSKANQRQHQRRKGKGKYQFRKVRMKEIPFACKKCGQTKSFITAVAYTAGGVKCPKCKALMSMNPKEFPNRLVKK